MLSSLKTKLQPAKIVKNIAGLAITTAIAFSAFACTNSNKNNSSNSNNSSNEQTSDNTNQSKYSELLQNILKSNYYNYLLEQAEKDNSFYLSPKFDPHPYAFYNDEGFDVEAIKNGEIACRTQSFVKEEEPNHLYIATYVENKAGNYYHQYMLKYELTDKEMADYDMLHYHDGGKFYVQAVFMNNEISKYKTPEVLCETKLDKTAHAEMCKSFSLTSLNFGSEFFEVILKSYNKEKEEFELYVMPDMSDSFNMKSFGCKMACYVMASSNQRIVLSNNVFMAPYKFGQFDAKATGNENAVKSVLVYHPQTTSLTNNKAKVL